MRKLRRVGLSTIRDACSIVFTLEKCSVCWYGSVTISPVIVAVGSIGSAIEASSMAAGWGSASANSGFWLSGSTPVPSSATGIAAIISSASLSLNRRISFDVIQMRSPGTMTCGFSMLSFSYQIPGHTQGVPR